MAVPARIDEAIRDFTRIWVDGNVKSMVGRKSLNRASVVIALAASALLIVVPWREPTNPNRTAASVRFARVSPSSDPNGEIECESLTFVDFTYEVFNRGPAPITELKIGTKCACEEIGAPPANILPGEKGTIRFRLRAPRGGLLRRQIPLVVEGATEPVALLDVALRVKFNPPQFLAPPHDVALTFIQGSHLGQEIVFDALEAKSDVAWIRAIDLHPPDGIQVLPVQVEDIAEPDPTLTHRRYLFRVLNRSLAVGEYTATATLQTESWLPPIEQSSTVFINVVDSVVIAPNPLVFKYPAGSQPPSRRVKILSRAGTTTMATAVKYDHDLVQVAEAQQARTMVEFDVVPKTPSTSARETQVQFDLHSGDIGRRAETLTIRFEPSSP